MATMITDINPRRRNVSIRVRVLVSWHQPPYGNMEEAEEFVFMDENADKIQASIKTKIYNDFKTVLYEGSTIVVDGFSVGANPSKYAVIQNRYKVLMVNSTKINAITDFHGPDNGFRFTKFQDIVDKRNPRGQDTVDIIGSIVSLGDVVEFEKKGLPTKRITVYLNDLDSVSIKCTLFGVFAEQLEGLLAKADATRHAILIVQFAKINDYGGHFSVTNAFYGTRVFLNADIPEITDFKQILLARPQGQPAFVRYNANSQTAYSVPDDFFIGCEPIALSDITDHHKEAWYVTLATIDSIHQEERWWYSACKKCYKGVQQMTENELRECPNPGNGLKCGGCGPNPTSMFPRYKVNVRVLNDTGSASFTLFDRHVQRMVTVSASDLRTKMVDADDVFPEELNVLIGKKLLFKVEVSKYNIRENYQYYTVSACTDDAVIIQRYKNLFEPDTETMSDAHIQALETSDAAVPLADISAKDAVSQTADNGKIPALTDSTADSPPAKRNRDNQVDDEPLSVKSEYNKAKKRLVKAKDEKP